MTDERLRARTYYFADGEPAGKPLDEYMLAFGPDADGSLQVWQCRESVVFHDNVAMIVFEEGDAISGADGNLHRAALCRLCAEEELDSFEWDEMPDCYVMDLPEELIGIETHVVDHIDEDMLDLLRLSINMARSRDEDGNVEPGDQKESIWRRLGNKSKRLF